MSHLGTDPVNILEFLKKALEHYYAEKRVNGEDTKQRTLDTWLKCPNTSKSSTSIDTSPVCKVNVAEQPASTATSPIGNITQQKQVFCREKRATKKNVNCTSFSQTNKYSSGNTPKTSILVTNKNTTSGTISELPNGTVSSCLNTKHSGILPSETARDKIAVESSEQAGKLESKPNVGKASSRSIKKKIRQVKNTVSKKVPGKAKSIRVTRTSQHIVDSKHEHDDSCDVSQESEGRDSVTDNKKRKRNFLNKSAGEKDQHSVSESSSLIELFKNLPSGVQECKRKGKQTVAMPCKKIKTTSNKVQEDTMQQSDLKKPVPQRKRGRPSKKGAVNQAESGHSPNMCVKINRSDEDHHVDFVPVLNVDDKNYTISSSGSNSCSFAGIITASSESNLGNVLDCHELDVLATLPCGVSCIISDTSDDKVGNESVENTTSSIEEESQNCNSDIFVKESDISIRTDSKTNFRSKACDVKEADVEVLNVFQKQKKSTGCGKATMQKRPVTSKFPDKRSLLKKRRKSLKDSTITDESSKETQGNSKNILQHSSDVLESEVLRCVPKSTSTPLHLHTSCDVDIIHDSAYNLRVQVNPTHSDLDHDPAAVRNSDCQSDLQKQNENLKLGQLMDELKSVSCKLKDFLSKPEVQKKICSHKQESSGWMFVKQHTSENGQVVGPSLYLLRPALFHFLSKNFKENSF